MKRHYEWLYNRYCELQQLQQQPPPEPQVVKPNYDKYHREIEALEDKNEGLVRENKSLRREVDNLKRDLQEATGTNRYEVEYKKEINLLKNNNEELMLAMESQKKEIARLQGIIKNDANEWEFERKQLIKERTDNVQRCIELQQSLDQLRNQRQPSPPRSNQSQAIEEYLSSYIESGRGKLR